MGTQRPSTRNASCIIFILFSYLVKHGLSVSVRKERKGAEFSFNRDYTGVSFDPVAFIEDNGMSQNGILNDGGLSVLINKIHTKFDEIMLPIQVPPKYTGNFSNHVVPEVVANLNNVLNQSGLATSFMKLNILCEVGNWNNISLLQTQFHAIRKVLDRANSIYPGTVKSVLLGLGDMNANQFHNFALFRSLFWYNYPQKQLNFTRSYKFGIQFSIRYMRSSYYEQLHKILRDKLLDILYLRSNGISNNATEAVDVCIKLFHMCRDFVQSRNKKVELGFLALWSDSDTDNIINYQDFLTYSRNMDSWATKSNTSYILFQAFDTPFAASRAMRTNGWWWLIPNSSYTHPTQFVFQNKTASALKEALPINLTWLSQPTQFSRDKFGVAFNHDVLQSGMVKPDPRSWDSLMSLLQQISKQFSKIFVLPVGASLYSYSTPTGDYFQTRVYSLRCTALLNSNTSQYHTNHSLEVTVTFGTSTVNQITKLAQAANEIFNLTVTKLVYKPSEMEQLRHLGGDLLKVKGFPPTGFSDFGLGMLINQGACNSLVEFQEAMLSFEFYFNLKSLGNKSIYVLGRLPSSLATIGVERALPLTILLFENCRKVIHNYFRQLWRNESVGKDVEVAFVTIWSTNRDEEEENLEDILQSVRFWEGMNDWAEQTGTPVILANAFAEPPNMGWSNVWGWWQLLENDTFPKSVDDYVFEDKKEAALRLVKARWVDAAADSSSIIGFIETIGIFAFLLILTILIAIVYFLKQRSSNYLTDEDIANFFNGATNDSGSSAGNASESVVGKEPYQSKHLEFPKSKFKVDELDILGSGAYGKVCRGRVLNLKNEEWSDVAVKMTKVPCPRTALRGLLFEIKTLAYLGKHSHIVELIGAYTAQLRKGNALVFLELCGLGSVQSYLRKFKHPIERGQEGTETAEKDDEDDGPSPSESELDEALVSDMARWSWEIAGGMEFIASKHIVHLDIATRNILLTEEKQAKITDFGLSRRMYDYQTYIKKEQEPLPWRWMAPESLRKSEFSEKSDVWSFGVLLWEIYSLADEPFPGLGFDFNFPTKLERGLRLEPPTYNRDDMYSIMLRCWAINPERRPSFSELVAGFPVPTLESEPRQSSPAKTDVLDELRAIPNHAISTPENCSGQDQGASENIRITTTNSTKHTEGRIIWSSLLLLLLLLITITAVLTYDNYTEEVSYPTPNRAITLKERNGKHVQYNSSQSSSNPSVAGYYDGLSSSDEVDHLNGIPPEQNNNENDIAKALGLKLFPVINDGDEDGVKLLVQLGADVNVKSVVENFKTPLTIAAHGIDKEVVLRLLKYLIENGADVNGKNSANLTFLHELVSDGSNLSALQFHYMTVYLISKNFTGLFNIRGWSDGATPLHAAVKNINVEKDTLRLLGQNGIDLNVVTRTSGNSILSSALLGKRSRQFLEDLVDLNVSWKHLNYINQSLLHIAAEGANIDGIKYLVELGLGINAQDNFGGTPLHVAMYFGRPDTLFVTGQTLLANGADASIRNRWGKTPLDFLFMRNDLVDKGNLTGLLMVTGN